MLTLSAMVAAALLQLGVAPAPPSAARTAVAQAPAVDRAPVDRAAAALQSTEAALAKVRAERRALELRYQAELAEVDRLKQGRASWRRDRQIRDQLARSLETAKRLAEVSRTMNILSVRLTTDRTALRAVVDRELQASVSTERRRWLLRQKTALDKVLRKVSKKITLPDDSIDPLADPEELEQQAALLKQSELALAREIEALDEQVGRYRRMSELRSKHARADELGAFEDDGPRRSTGRPSDGRGGAAADSDSESVPGSGAGAPADPDGLAGFDDQAAVLAEIILPATVDALRRADRSSDPRVKADAATAARAEVEARLEKLKEKRALIEKRARLLKGK